MKPSEPVVCQVRGVLLDIEGTTSSISFVHDVMFPFVRHRLNEFLDQHFARPDVAQACEQIRQRRWPQYARAWSHASALPAAELVRTEVIRLMDGDVKATGLKALQGVIWEEGFYSGQLQSHVYPDVLPQIANWRREGIDVRIYSSGSIAAQKLFFGHVATVGNCLDCFSGHYDTTTGPKKEAGSYLKIAEDWAKAPSDLLFVSDLGGELEAASQAGLQVIASVRPGNAPLPAECPAPRVTSFSQIHLTLPSR